MSNGLLMISVIGSSEILEDFPSRFLKYCLDIMSTLNRRSLKLVDKFTHLGSSIASTENDSYTLLAKAWTAIHRISVIVKSDLLDKIKRSFFNLRSCQYCYTDEPHGRWLSVWRENLTAIAQECCELYWTGPGGSIPQSSSCTDVYHPSRKPSKLDEQDMWGTAGEVNASS